MRASGVVVLIAVLGLATPSVMSAQSLAEVAAKEKERREKLKKQQAPDEEKQSFSEEDLYKARRSGARLGNESESPGTSSGEAASEEAGGDEADAEGEKTEDEVRAEEETAWREQLQAAEADRARLDEEIDRVQAALNDNTQNMFGTARKSRLDRLEEAKAMRDEADARIAALEQEGRRKRFRK